MICCFYWYKKKSATFGPIPKILKINEQNYAIADAVSYHQYASDKNDGHYTANVYHTSGWYLYDDMVIKRRIASDGEQVALAHTAVTLDIYICLI